MVCSKTVGGTMTRHEGHWQSSSKGLPAGCACLCPHPQDTRCRLPVAGFPVPTDLFLPLNDPLHDLLILLCIL